MNKYISKDAIVAEIERLKNADLSHLTSDEADVYLNTLDLVETAICTLEVKEVDLDKELNDFIEQQKAWIKDDWVVEYNNGNSFNHIYDLREFAKHFFELGIKAQKGE